MNFKKNSHFALFDSLANMPKILSLEVAYYTQTQAHTDRYHFYILLI